MIADARHLAEIGPAGTRVRVEMRQEMVVERHTLLKLPTGEVVYGDIRHGDVEGEVERMLYEDPDEGEETE